MYKSQRNAIARLKCFSHSRKYKILILLIFRGLTMRDEIPNSQFYSIMVLVLVYMLTICG